MGSTEFQLKVQRTRRKKFMAFDFFGVRNSMVQNGFPFDFFDVPLTWLLMPLWCLLPCSKHMYGPPKHFWGNLRETFFSDFLTRTSKKNILVKIVIFSFYLRKILENQWSTIDFASTPIYKLCALTHYDIKQPFLRRRPKINFVSLTREPTSRSNLLGMLPVPFQTRNFAIFA